MQKTIPGSRKGIRVGITIKTSFYAKPNMYEKLLTQKDRLVYRWFHNFCPRSTIDRARGNAPGHRDSRSHPDRTRATGICRNSGGFDLLAAMLARNRGI